MLLPASVIEVMSPERIRPARCGDEDAAARLTREFEPFIRRFVRFRMRNRPDHQRLRPELDSADICQSIFKSLFVGLRDGRFELDQPEQLEKLLSAMVRLKVANQARRLSVTLREVLDWTRRRIGSTRGRVPRRPWTTRTSGYDPQAVRRG